MKVIAVHTVAIIWGDYIVTELFSVNEISEPPDEAVYSYASEYIADGASRKLASVNTENIFSITVARETAKQENIDLFKQLFNEDKSYRLRLVHLTTGDVLVEYKTASLANTKFMGSVASGQGVNFTIAWTVTNEKN